MNLEQKLQKLGYDLPAAAPPAANYVPYTLHDGIIYVAGQIPFLNGEPMHKGRLGEDMSLEDGVKAAEAG